jgi:hypothetical protein
VCLCLSHPLHDKLIRPAQLWRAIPKQSGLGTGDTNSRRHS